MVTSVRNGDIVGNGYINFVTHLSLAMLTLYLAWCLFRTMEIDGNGDIVRNGDIVGNGNINFVTPLS